MVPTVISFAFLEKYHYRQSALLPECYEKRGQGLHQTLAAMLKNFSWYSIHVRCLVFFAFWIPLYWLPRLRVDLSLFEQGTMSTIRTIVAMKIDSVQITSVCIKWVNFSENIRAFYQDKWNCLLYPGVCSGYCWLCSHAVVVHRGRDREPSKISSKTVICSLKKKK